MSATGLEGGRRASLFALGVHGETVHLLPQRAVFWPSRQTLLVADLHWGKAEAFQAHGIPIPTTVLDTDLARLSDALSLTRATRLVVLGDLIHGRHALSKSVTQRIQTWRQGFGGEIVLVAGNHDHHLAELPTVWRITRVAPPWVDPPFAFTHAPTPLRGHFVWAGHRHPCFATSASSRLACFHWQTARDVCVLPAFSDFTSGATVRAQADDRLFVIADSTVVEL